MRRPALVETTAFGAAGLAGLALGFWKSPEDYLGARGGETVFEPRASAEERAEWRSGWSRALTAARAWAGSEEG